MNRRARIFVRPATAASSASAICRACRPKESTDLILRRSDEVDLRDASAGGSILRGRKTGIRISRSRQRSVELSWTNVHLSRGDISADNF